MDVKWVLATLATLIAIQGCVADLKLVQVVHRHGNRAPAYDTKTYYPLDPYRNETYYPEGWGGLTNDGKWSVYELGRYLHRRYGSFLGPIYTRDVIRFQADEVERIVMSAQLVGAALFPPTKLQRWHEDLKWQPIPIWMEPIESDLLYNGVYCTKHAEMRANAEATDPILLKRNEELKSFYDYMSEHTGTNMTHFTSFLLRQNLHAQLDIGLKLPQWTKPVFPNGKLDEVAAFDLVIQSYTIGQKQLMGGPWLEEWLKHVHAHLDVTAAEKRKAYIYASHEINIAGILIALNAFDYNIPNYSSAVIFELHEVNGEHFVQIMYRNNDVVQTLLIPGCKSSMCPLQTFEEVVAPVISDDLQATCGEIVLRL